jgi:hypothetical protein
MQGDREGNPSSSQSCLQELHVQLHVALLFLLPNRNLNQTSGECLVNVWGRVEILREDWTAAYREGKRGYKLWEEEGGEPTAEEKEYCQTFPKLT